MHQDRLRWNQRYRQAPAGDPGPRAFLVEAAAFLPAGGRALDLACGRGHEAIWLAGRGFVVDALDISEAALAQGGRAATQAGVADRVRFVPADLDDGLAFQPGPSEAATVGGPYQLICALHFRSDVVDTAIDQALGPHGVLVATRLSVVGHSPDQPGRGGPGPDSAFYAVAGELLALAERHGLAVLRHEEHAGQARLVARR